MIETRPRRAHESSRHITLVLSDDVLSKNVNAQESSRLCSLPREILDLICEYLRAQFMVVLMMACKHLAKIGKLRGTNPPPTDDVEYYGMLSKLASWMPRSLKLCGKCRMYRMRATEQYQEGDWRGLWLQEYWEMDDNTRVEYTNEIFMCPLHRINYRDLCNLGEIERTLMPFPATLSETIRLPSEGTGGLAVRLHYRLNSVAHVSPLKEDEPGFKANVKRRRFFNIFGSKKSH